jgi:aldehyde:ferredoxin oxidoreductase
LEPAGFDPRVLKGMGLSYATAARGACHLRGTFYKAELTGQIDKDTIRGKAALHIDYEDRAALFDSLILCRFFRDFLFWEEIGTLIEAATGRTLTKQELEGIANRITEDTRRFNIREGIGARDDTLPPRLFQEATQEGSSISPSDLAIMVDEYNALRKQRDD